MLPAHIRHHYCDLEVSFWDNQNFIAPDLERSLKTYNYVTQEYQIWAEALIGLGSNFGITGAYAGDSGPRGGGADAPRLDLTALTTLDEVRTQTDLPALKERLDTPIQKLEEDPTVQGMKF